MNRAIGILGGTFAPVHNGHLRLAIEARERLGLDEVRLIPCATPPHRLYPTASPRQRLKWVRTAVKGIAGLTVDDRELKRKGPSYSVDTLEQLRRDLPGRTLCLLLGSDAAAGLESWHRYADIPRLAHLVVFERPGVKAALADRQGLWQFAPAPEALARREAGIWLQLRAPLPEVSATYIRQRIRAGGELRGLVPAAVLKSMTKEDLEILAKDETPSFD